MGILIELHTVEHGNHSQVLHVTVLHDGIEDDLPVGIHILQLLPGDVLQEGGNREDGTGTEPAAHVVAADMIEHRIVGDVEDVILQLLQTADAHDFLVGFRVTEDEIAEAHVLLHQATEIHTHLLGVLIYKAESLGFCLGTVVALGTLDDERHERIGLADVTEETQSGIRTFLTSEGIGAVLGIRLLLHLVAESLGGTLQRESGIADDTQGVVGILIVEFLRLFVGTGEHHLRTATHSHRGSMAVEGFLGKILALLEDIVVEVGQDGTVEAHGVFYQEYHLHACLPDIVLQVHLILNELDDGEDEVGVAQPAEYVIEDAEVFVLHSLGDAVGERGEYHAVDIRELAFDITRHIEGIVVGIARHTDDEVDETTGLEEKIITDSKNKAMVPSCDVIDANGEIVGTYNFPVGGHLVVEDGQTIKTGEVLVKIPRAVGGAGDITGGLPRVTELLEARNPSNPAVVSEIDGEVTMGKVKRGNREIIVTSKTGDQKKYLVSLSKQILVQEHDAVRAGTPLSDGSVTPGDILAIMGPTAVQEYIVNQIQDVYRLQGVAINDKHFEVVVRQMMRKVRIDDPGDTTFLEQELVDKLDFAEENDRIWGKKVVTNAGDSTELKPGQIITARKLRDENSALKRRDMKLVQVRDAVAATSTQILQGITRAALGTKSFMSAASFQETTKVLNEAAIRGKVDYLEGMKENVICGHLIPAGTGLRQWEKLVVGSKEEYERMQANRKNVLDYADSPIVD